jgi:DNA (cytosine-5)-methyltransferase 1
VDRAHWPQSGEVTSIPVVDVFAGAGGLGEGFSAYTSVRSGVAPFKVALSAEMDGHAVRTLQTRAFFRQFAHGDAPKSYYDYAMGRAVHPWTPATENAWRSACDEALQLQLGQQRDDEVLRARVQQVADNAKRHDLPWVLVGGPPCQAYSLVGRARNRGNVNYVPEEDARHFLYEHYLALISEFRPAAFVLENVKGMLSSQIDGESVFDEIFERLQRPGGRYGPRYRIQPLVQNDTQQGGWEPRDFLVQTEKLGLPQARHRVILVGVLEETSRMLTPLHASEQRFTVGDMIAGLPRLRSSLTDATVHSWPRFASQLLSQCARYAKTIDRTTAAYLRELAGSARDGEELGIGDRWLPGKVPAATPAHLAHFIKDPKLRGVLSHHTRGHMESDLMRYGFAAAFAEVNGRSPRGAAEFPDELHPNHQSWLGNQKFIDRFKVQRSNTPSSTITSHLAKDGHYFIHPDPAQLRSLTIREAARLQTFPDNFIFEGPPGSQRKQVGNAVPPWLAYQIAGAVHKILA